MLALLYAIVCFILASCSLLLSLTIRPRWIELLPKQADHERIFKFSPNELTKFDIVLLISAFIIRAVKIALGVQTRLASLIEAGNGSTTACAQDIIPKYFLTFPFIVRPQDISAYSKALHLGANHDQFSGGADVELKASPNEGRDSGRASHLCLFLSAITEPAFLILLAQRECPIQPLGAVNVKNIFELLDQKLALDLVNSATSTAIMPAKVTAKFVRGLRRVKRGTEIDIIVSIWVFSKDSNDIEVFRQTFTILEFAPWARMPEVFKPNPTTTPVLNNNVWGDTDIPSEHKIRMESNDPTLWATLCLDYNPIHHIDIAARLAGFRGKLAHGNHVAARAIFASQSKSSESGQNNNKRDRNFVMEVVFRRPVVVPARLHVKQACIAPSEGLQYDVLDQQGKTCVSIVQAQ